MKYHFVIKRILELLLALLLLPVIIIFLAAVSIILLFELKESPFFVQDRGLTLSKHRFFMVKLKTIRTKKNEEFIDGSKNILVKTYLESSLTPFAKWLRRTGLDELPQIFHVITGKMSLVGPRPLMLFDLQFIEKNFPEFYRQRDLLGSKPGITGLWQIFCNREQGIENLIILDELYETERSFVVDLKILLLTLATLFSGSNDDAIVSNNNSLIKNFSWVLRKAKIKYRTLSQNSLVLLSPHQFDNKIEIPFDWWENTNSYEPYASNKHKLRIFRIEKNSA